MHWNSRTPLALAVGLTLCATGAAQTAVLDSAELPSASPPYAQFGYDLASLGDLDGDGIADVAVGDPYWSGAGQASGGVWIQFLEADGSVKGTQLIASGIGGFTETLADYQWFGRAVEPAGDRDGDGLCDLYVGAPMNYAVCSTCPGYLYLLYLNADGTVKSHVRIGHGEGFPIDLEPADPFGQALALLDDLNGDGTRDLAITGADGGLFVCRTRADGTLRNCWQVGNGLGGTTMTTGFNFGLALEVLPDLDGDGVCELAIGQPEGAWWLDLAVQSSYGALWIYFLDPVGTVHRELEYDHLSLDFPVSIAHGDWFGASLAGLGDVDGDGAFELAVGAPGVDDGGDRTGALWVLSIEAEGVVSKATKIDQLANWPGASLVERGNFGSALAPLGDFDQDGVADLLGVAGAWPGYGDPAQQGRVYALRLSGLPFAAGSRIRNGTHVNPVVLRTTSRPRLGRSWTGELDATQHPGTTAVALVGHAERTVPGIQLPTGELLVDVGSALLLSELRQVTTGIETFSAAVPLDGALLGTEAQLQGALLRGGVELTNALQLTLGL